MEIAWTKKKKKKKNTNNNNAVKKKECPLRSSFDLLHLLKGH